MDEQMPPLNHYDAAAHMYPCDLEEFKEGEIVREAFSIPVGSPTHGESVPLWTTEQMFAYAKEYAEALSQPAAQEIDELKTICAETYQVVGSLASDLGIFGSCLQLGKVLDNLSEQKRVHNDVLPWPSFEAQGDSSHPAGGEFGGVQVHPMNYKGMWLASVSTLAKIDALLGLPEDGCNDPDVTLGALEDYMSGIKDIVGSSAFTIEDVRGWIAQGQARALAIDPDAAILTKSTCTMCNGTGKHFVATAHLPGQPTPAQQVVDCRQCSPKAAAHGISIQSEMLDALKTTAGNIRSLGPAGAILEPYKIWLSVVEGAIAKATP